MLFPINAICLYETGLRTRIFSSTLDTDGLVFSTKSSVAPVLTGATLIDYVSGYYFQYGAKLNAAKIPVAFLLFWGYLQQT